ncbi:MAG: hypothetical protein ACOYLH_11765, partial [Flavobacteriales bacterium]
MKNKYFERSASKFTELQRKFFVRTSAVLALIMLLGSSAVAQSLHSQYTFSTTSGTYTAITGGTQLWTSANMGTDGVSAAITIPSFTFNGTAYTSIYVNNNGYLTFGATAPTASGYTAISGTTAYSGAVAAFAGNLIASTVSGSACEVRSENLSGSSEFVVQWTDVARNLLAANDRFNFQIRLNY